MDRAPEHLTAQCRTRNIVFLRGMRAARGCSNAGWREPDTANSRRP